jgi:hypothetical protein
MVPCKAPLFIKEICPIGRFSGMLAVFITRIIEHWGIMPINKELAL